MKTAAFHTLGCKVNQYDTQAMLEKFRAAGYEIVPFDADADVYVINTCTVTGTGDKKSLQLARRLRREHPDSALILAGCLAQRRRICLKPARASSSAHSTAAKSSNCWKRRCGRTHPSTPSTS